MKKNLLLSLLLVILYLPQPKAQVTPGWTWAIGIGSQQYDNVQTLQVDKSGNTFLVGQTNGGSLYIGNNYVAKDTAEIGRTFLAKINASGQPVWTKSFYTKEPSMYGSNITVNKLVIDDNGNVYLLISVMSGEVGNTDTSTVVINGEKTMMLISHQMGSTKMGMVKLDRSGNIIYALPMRGYTPNYGYFTVSDICPGNQGELFFTGYLQIDTLTIGSKIAFGTDTTYTLFTGKIDASGTPAWLISDSTDQPAYYYGSRPGKIRLDASGNPLIYGQFDNANRKIGAYVITSAGLADLFLLSLNASDGSVLYFKGYGDTGAETADDFAFDHAGNIYITGYSNSLNLFGTFMVEVNNGIFLAKLSPAGDLIWNQNIDASIAYPYAGSLKIMVGKYDDVTLSGLFEGYSLSLGNFTALNHGTTGSADFFISRFNADGLPGWLQSLGTDTYDNQSSVYLDDHDGVDLYTSVYNPFIVGSDTITPPNGISGFVMARFDSTGNVASHAGYFPAANENYYTSYMCMAPSGLLYVSGTYSTPISSFGPNTLTLRDTVSGSDIFLGQMGYSLLGHVYDKDGNLVNSGYAKLFLLGINAAAQQLDSVPILEGSYYMNNAPMSNFIVYAETDTVDYPHYVGTYDGNVTLWNSAPVLNLSSDPALFNITLTQIIPPPGTCSISGNVFESDTAISKSKSAARPVKGASVVLVGKSNKGGDSIVLAITKTDEFGLYHFDNIAVGSYYVFVDVPGLGMKEYYALDLTPSAPAAENINYILKSTGIYKDLGTSVLKPVKTSVSELMVYPNPTTGSLFVNLSSGISTASFEIYDMTGKRVLSKTISGSGNPSVDVSSLPAGVYVLKITTTAQNPSFARFVKQ